MYLTDLTSVVPNYAIFYDSAGYGLCVVTCVGWGLFDRRLVHISVHLQRLHILPPILHPGKV